MFTGLICMAVGIMTGVGLTIGWYWVRKQHSTTNMVFEPTYPPNLTLIDFRTRTGTDHDGR